MRAIIHSYKELNYLEVGVSIYVIYSTVKKSLSSDTRKRKVYTFILHI